MDNDPTRSTGFLPYPSPIISVKTQLLFDGDAGICGGDLLLTDLLNASRHPQEVGAHNTIAA